MVTRYKSLRIILFIQESICAYNLQEKLCEYIISHILRFVKIIVEYIVNMFRKSSSGIFIQGKYVICYKRFNDMRS